MKRGFLYFLLIIISLGLIFGIRSAIKNRNTEMDNIVQESGDIYVHELNIPIMEIDTLNPLLTNNKYVSNLLYLIYEPLVSIKRDESLSPCLATEWAQKDDLNWIVKLRKDAKWHNGNSFTSNDVIFTINSLKSDEINSIYKANVSNIVNVEALDDYSVVFSLQVKDDLFMYKLLFPILPEYYFKNGDILNQDKSNIPVGTGAYKYVTNNFIDEYIQLEKNNEWWNTTQETKLNTIYLMKYPTYGEAIKAYKSAKVDIMFTSMSSWQKKFGTIGNNVYAFESSVFDTIIPNLKRGILSETSVRKAILYAINRGNIVSKVFDSNATVSDLPIHNNSKNYYSAFQSDYDIDKAKQILLNAGWKNDGKYWQKDGQRLKFTMLVNEDNSEQLRVAEIIKENLGDINIYITIKKINFSNFENAINKDDFELALASIDIKNEYSILDIVKSNSTLNFANYSNEKADELINNVIQNTNEDAMREFERIYKDEVPYIGLYFRNDTLLTNKSVKGILEPSWSNPYANIVTWCK